MKKNAMLKIAAILMVAVLLTTCAISSTFAKYVTTAGQADSARVAKWGVTAEVKASGAFAETYGDKVAVGLTDKKDLVAPGTSKVKAVEVTIAGQPEVATQITVGAGSATNFVVLEGWEITFKGEKIIYCPLEITVHTGADADTKGTVFKGTDYTSLTDFMDAINTKISGYLTTFNGATTAANTDLAKTLSIDWAWAFGPDDLDDLDDDVNVKDTLLGDTAVDHTIAFNFDIAIEQAGPAVTPAP